MLKVRITFEGHNVYYDKKGYALICLNGKDVKIHVFVWERVNGKKPKGHDIHHKDFDKSNYQLDNLELLTQSDHFRIHAGWIKTNGEWSHKPCTSCGEILPLNDFYKRATAKTPSALCKECHCKRTRERKPSAESIERRREYKRNYDFNHKKGVIASC